MNQKNNFSLQNYSLLLFLMIASIPLGYAQRTSAVTDIGVADSLDMSLVPKVAIGYGNIDAKNVTSAIVTIEQEAFNKGLIYDPALLIQAKVAGLQIYNRGNNPNQQSTIRLRSLSSGSFTQSLIVIDGVIGASLQNVDPNDIDRITVLKDGATTIYGARGSDGVLLISTKKGTNSKKMQWSYKSQLAAESAVSTIPNMNAAEFIAAGGEDLGAQTDWIDEITTTPINHNHHVAVSGGIGEHSNMRISANYRDRKGILKNTGFEQFNTRLNFSSTALEEKLKIDVHTAYTNSNQKNGYEEAFRYAIFYNPTAPILGANAPFPFESEQYGGFFESLGLFDSYNPVSIINQNKKETQRTAFNFGANLAYEINDKLTLNLRLAKQTTDINTDVLAPTTALFLGNASSPIRKGFAEFREGNSDFSLYEVFGTYSTDFSKGNLQFTTGYSYQQNNFNSSFFSFGDFKNNNLDLSNLSFSSLLESSQNFMDVGLIQANSISSINNKRFAFFARTNFDVDDAIFVNASIRSAPAAILEANNKWSVFPALGVGVDLNRYWPIAGLDLFKVRMSYGITGTSQNYAVQEIKSIIFSGPGNTVSTQLTGDDLDLKEERKATLNLGVEITSRKFSGVLEVYNRNTADLILQRTLDPTLFGVDNQVDNVGKLNTKGLEIALTYNLIQTADRTYTTGIVLATYKTVLKEYILNAETRGNLSAFSQTGTNVILLKEGEEIGKIWGPVYTGVSASGNQIFEDINGDGRLVTSQSNALDEEADFEVLGNGLPNLELGWTNQLRFGDWSINAFFRGAFGHSLVNNFRMFHEPRSANPSPYNFVNTTLAIPELRTTTFSSLYVEKADFFKLDNLTISKRFDLKEAYLRSAQFSLTIMNAFVLTKYTGSSPEPNLLDYGLENIGTNSADVFAPGIDRRNNYFTARTFVLGLNLNF